MAKAELVIHLEAGTPRTGIWCERCLTPGIVEIDVVRISGQGVSPMLTARRCQRCWVDAADDDV